MSEAANRVPNILVIGDFMLDHYLWGSCERISPEAPVQVVDIRNESHLLGGAGNVVNNLLALGANASVLSVLGDDDTAATIKELLSDQGVNIDHLYTQSGRTTGVKSRVMATHQQIVRCDRETADPISPSSGEKLLDSLRNIVSGFDIVLMSDYAKGVLTDDLCKRMIEVCNEHEVRVLVDPKGKNYGKYRGAFLIKPNRIETIDATGIAPDNDATTEQAGHKIRIDHAIDHVLITLSDKGIALIEEDGLHRFPAEAMEVFDVTGAGDTVLASLGYALAEGNNLRSAVEFANAAAAVVVGKLGSATATLDEILHHRSSRENVPNPLRIIQSKSQLKQIVETERKRGNKIVFTNGCFDILHAGHVRYLEETRALGDILIVGVNSDDSIQRLKGENRPVVGESDRAYLVAALKSVDYVVVFSEDTPLDVIEIVRPDCLTKGGDYKVEDIVGREYAGETIVLDYISGKSTTNIITAIKEQ